MFRTTSKSFVLFLSCLIFFSQFDLTSCKPCMDQKDCGPGACDPACKAGKCPKQGNGRGARPVGCKNASCVGKCGRPECKAMVNRQSGSGDKMEPVACGLEHCKGECRAPGCMKNRMENQMPDCGEDSMSASPAKSSSSTGNAQPLAGNLDCQKFSKAKNTGPIFTSSSSSKPEPKAQCARCSLQPTDDNSGVILTCYDCKDVKPDDPCGGSSDEKEARSSTTNVVVNACCKCEASKEKSCDKCKPCKDSNQEKQQQKAPCTPCAAKSQKAPQLPKEALSCGEQKYMNSGTDTDIEASNENLPEVEDIDSEDYGEPTHVILACFIEIPSYTEQNKTNSCL